MLMKKSVGEFIITVTRKDLSSNPQIRNAETDQDLGQKTSRG